MPSANGQERLCNNNNKLRLPFFFCTVVGVKCRWQAAVEMGRGVADRSNKVAGQRYKDTQRDFTDGSRIKVAGLARGTSLDHSA